MSLLLPETPQLTVRAGEERQPWAIWNRSVGVGVGGCGTLQRLQLGIQLVCCYLHIDCQQAQRCTSRTECHSVSLLEYPTCLSEPACIRLPWAGLIFAGPVVSPESSFSALLSQAERTVSLSTVLLFMTRVLLDCSASGPSDQRGPCFKTSRLADCRASRWPLEFCRCTSCSWSGSICHQPELELAPTYSCVNVLR